MEIISDLSDVKIGDILYGYYLCRSGENKNKILCKNVLVMHVYPDVLALHVMANRDDGQSPWNSLNVSRLSGTSITKDIMYHIVFKEPNEELARKYIVGCMEHSLKEQADKLMKAHKCYIDVIHKNEGE